MEAMQVQQLKTELLDKIHKISAGIQQVPKISVPALLQPHATLKQHQVAGLNWLVATYKNGVNGILVRTEIPILAKLNWMLRGR